MKMHLYVGGYGDFDRCEGLIFFSLVVSLGQCPPHLYILMCNLYVCPSFFGFAEFVRNKVIYSKALILFLLFNFAFPFQFGFDGPPG